jgi:hypothetical protein
MKHRRDPVGDAVLGTPAAASAFPCLGNKEASQAAGFSNLHTMPAVRAKIARLVAQQGLGVPPASLDGRRRHEA